MYNSDRALSNLGMPNLPVGAFCKRVGKMPELHGGGGGKGGGAPSPPPPMPPAPTMDNTAGEGDVAAQQMALALQRGRTATMLTGGGGLSNKGTTSKNLLGS